MADKKPNILLIMADQFRGDCIGLDEERDVKTPVIDSLLEEGVHFKKAYSPSPVCVPARISLTTGEYAHKVCHNKTNSGAIPDEYPKLAEWFKDHGYKTYASGKLHYPYTGPGVPHITYGFEKAALAESGRMLLQFDLKDELGGVEEYHDYLKSVGWGGYSRAHGVGNNDIHPCASPLPQEHYVDAWVASTALGYLDEHIDNDSEKPFLLYMGFPKPHSPFDPPRPYDNMYSPRELEKPFQAKEDHVIRNPNKGAEAIGRGHNLVSPEAVQVIRSHYYGQISFQDKQIGRLVDALKEKGVYEDTIIVFCADHGEMLGDFGFFFKSCFYKGSVEVPFMFHYPKALSKGHVSEVMVGLQDIFPSLASLCGIPLEKEVDGNDLTETLQGSKTQLRDYFVSYYDNSPKQVYFITDSKIKFMYSEMGGVEEFYDVVSDPDEEFNLIQDKGRKDEINLWRSRLIKWIGTNEENVLVDGKLPVSPLKKEEWEFKASGMGWRWY